MKRRSNQGSVLITVMVILLLASFAVLATTLTLRDYAQAQAKVRDEMQAVHAAEAGAWEVVSWFNTSGTAITDMYPSETDFASLFKREGGTTTPYTKLETRLQALGHAGLDVSRVEPGLLPVLRNDRGSSVGQVTELFLYGRNFDPLAGTHVYIPDVVCIVNSVAKTQMGDKEVWVYLQPWWLEGAPAGIISKAAANFGGNAKGHWGEVWAKSNLDIPAESQMKKDVNGDPWLKLRSERKIYFDSTWGVPSWGVPYHTEAGYDVVDGTNRPTDGITIKGVDYTGYTEQNCTLDWPEYDYERFKLLAMRKGRYFVPDAAGNLYRDGVMDAAHLVADIPRELNTGTMADRSTDPATWRKTEYDVAFIDTIDRQPPRADGSNLATIKINGDEMSWKGFYYLNVHLNLAGSPTSAIPCKDPDGVYQNMKAFCDGIICATGVVNVSGNPVVYGSVFGRMGFTGTGTLDVYYNVDLANGFPVPLHPMTASKYKVER